MEYEIREISPFQIVGVCVKTTNENNQSQDDIKELWDRFFAEKCLERIEPKASGAFYGYYTDYEGDHTKPYTLFACMSVREVPADMEGLSHRRIPAGKYAVFQIKGTFPDVLIETWTHVWSSDLRRAFDHDFEYYPEGWHPVDNPDCELYIRLA